MLQEIKIYRSIWKPIRLILLSTIIFATGLLMLDTYDSDNWINWIVIVCGGLGYPVALFQLFDRRPLMRINEIGIFDRTQNKDFINWDIIQDAYIASVRKEKFICLIINQDVTGFKKSGKFRRTMEEIAIGMGFQKLNLSIGFTDVEAEKMLEFILAMRHAKKAERIILLPTWKDF